MYEKRKFLKKKLSLKQVWVWLILSAVFVPFILIFTWFSQDSYNTKLNSALTLKEQTNTSISYQIELEVYRLKTLLLNKSDPLSFLVVDAATTKHTRQINHFLTRIIEREKTIHEVMLISPQGEVLTVIDPDLKISADDLLPVEALKSIGQYWGVVNAIKQPEIIIPLLGRSYIGSAKPHDDTFVFTIAVPVGKPTKAILIALVDLHILWGKDIVHAKTESDSRDYLLDKQGVLLTRVDGSEYKSGDLLTHLDVVGNEFIGDEWLKEEPYIGILGEPVYGTITTVSSMNWSLVSEVGVSQITKPIIGYLHNTLILVLPSMALFAWLVMYLVQKTLKPVNQLGSAINQVAKGQYQWTVDSSGILELDAMSVSFNKMAKARQRAEVKLKEGEQDLLITLNSIGDAVITTDAGGCVTRMNPIAEKLTGWSIRQASGLTVGKVFPLINVITREPIPNPVEKVLSTGETVHLKSHSTLVAKGGEEYQISNSAAPICGDTGTVQGMVLVFNDVSKQYRLREEATLIQQRIQSLFNSMQTMAAILNVEGEVEFTNSGALEVLELDLNDLLGVKLWRCGWFNYDDSVALSVQKDYERGCLGEHVYRDVQVRTISGYLWVEYSLHPIFDIDGRLKNLIVEGRDISIRKRLENEMDASLQQLKLYRDQTPLAAINWNINFEVEDWNLAAENMFGYTLAEVREHDFNMMLLDSSKLNVKKVWEDLMSQTGGTRHIMENKTKEGKVLLCEWYSKAIVNDLGDVIGLASLVLDITQAKEQQAQLQRAEKMDAMGKLVGGIAHDYNNMLGVILVCTDLIKKKFADVDGLQKYITNIVQAGKRGQNLTQRMLDFSKKESTSASAELMADILISQKDLLSKVMTALITVNYDLCDSDWLIKVDRSELEDALVNLSLNAQHAMPNGGTLTYTTQAIHLPPTDAELLDLPSGDYLKLSIKDTGCGMSDELINKIFDPFFSTKGVKGTGLGLSQVYGLVERCGGGVKVYSEISIGTEFCFYFPRYCGDDNAGLEQPTLVLGDAIGEGQVILIVDDEAALREAAAELLTLSGYQTLMVCDGVEALEVLANKPVDLVLSDVIMPNLGGFRLAQQVRRLYPNIKIQLVSGFSDSKQSEFTNDPLQTALIYKPYSSDELITRISCLLKG